MDELSGVQRKMCVKNHGSCQMPSWIEQILIVSRSNQSEVCGIVTNKCRFIQIKNAHEKPLDHFIFDPDETLAAYAEMDSRDEDPWIIWHSHPCSLAQPSMSDKYYADPTCLMAIAGTDGLRVFEFDETAEKWVSKCNWPVDFQ